MPYRYPAAVRGYIIPMFLGNFTGGLNLRDYPSEIADNESPACENVTIDSRGGVTKRLGLKRLDSVTGTNIPTNYTNLFFWPVTKQWIAHDSPATIKASTDLVNWTTILTLPSGGTTFCPFADFAGKLFIGVPLSAGGIYVYTGTGSATLVTAGQGSPKAQCLAVWQNKLWAAVGNKIYASHEGNADTTTPNPADPPNPFPPWDMTNDFNSILEKDSLPITALGGGQGMDISGRPGLMVFKADSTYRINESRSSSAGTDANPIFFGAYTTLHTHAGAAGPLSVTTAATGQTCFIGQRGIYMSDGVNAPTQVSARIEPFFSDEELEMFAGAIAMWSAGRYRDRVLFSVTRNHGEPDYTLEFNPTQGWIVPHSFGVRAFAESFQDEKEFVGAMHSKITSLFSGGTDDGNPISARWQSRWFEPFGGYAFRMRRLRVVGRGEFQLYTKVDFTQSEGVLSQFQSFDSSSEWGSGSWGQMLWGSKPVEAYNDFFSLGHGKSVSFVINETSGDVLLGPPLNETGAAMETGAFTFYSAKLDMVRFGYT